MRSLPIRHGMVALMTALLWPAPVSSASLATSLEYEVKAAFLFNFLGFTEWPPAAFARADDPVRLCIAGHDPFGAAIDNVVKAERVGGRSVVVERLEESETAERCTMLFVPAGVPAARWLGSAGAHTLTVGEHEGFLREGGMIALVLDAGRVRFDVNVEAAVARDIRISARVLRLARSTLPRKSR